MRRKAAVLLSLLLTCAAVQADMIMADNRNDTEENSTEKIRIEKIDDLPQDFVLGADISSILAQFESGVCYYDFSGQPLDEQGFFDLLARGGTDCVRVRVWNDPYDGQGRTYGGGHNDLKTAVKIGQLATRAGMHVLIDFHYSDFWADPAKQMVPKAWEGMGLAEKAEALRAYTQESLYALLDAGVDISMVQIGNETNAYFCGESVWTDICRLMAAGSEAVRAVSAETGHEMAVVLHFSDPQREGSYEKYAAALYRHRVDYDIFASSYYPFWHGTTQNLTQVLKTIADRYGKRVMVAETQYGYTFEDGDGSGNTFGREWDTQTLACPVSRQGQADALRDVITAVLDVGDKAVGVFYWEPAWIPVRVWNGNAAVLEENRRIWENCGSGWATSFAGSYDPQDAGRFYGGSAVDNMAWFDFDGHPSGMVSFYRRVRGERAAGRRNR